jgi:very-short-patch-repair endonuclease
MNRQELALWESLRCKRFLGLTFRRKHLVLRFFDRKTGTEGAYISDFYCHKLRLAVEVDGMNTPRNEQRDAILKANGFRVLRFTRDEIERDRGAVLFAIRSHITRERDTRS